jgi:hypothetical protein
MSTLIRSKRIDVSVNSNLEGTILFSNDVDIQVTDGVNPVTPNDVTVVGDVVTIEVPAATPIPVGATLMPTGETITFATYDDFFYAPIDGRHPFLTLDIPNPFGNTFRFTGTTGGYKVGANFFDKDGNSTTQGLAIPDNIVIDWSTYGRNGKVLGWYTGSIPLETWANALTNANALTVGSYSVWKLPNRMEGFSLINRRPLVGGQSWNYDPLNINFMTIMWTSTTEQTADAYTWLASGASGTRAKTSTSYSFRCRTFTVTGTTLT